jgi:aspartyl-tRNA(Asn)/glutamyl-tRNA(Gln) amidotransferase subunit C
LFACFYSIFPASTGFFAASQNTLEFAMSLSLDDVKRIAHLARIEISADEADQTLRKLNDIFALIEKMQAVDTQGISPMAHPQSLSQRLRSDTVTESNQRAALQQPAPAVQDGLFLVPKVIE